MSPRRDPYFGRFALTVFTVALVVVVLGLAAIWFLAEGESRLPSAKPLQELLGRARGGRLAPNQALLYYTRDGRTLVGSVVSTGRPETSLTDKAENILSLLLDSKGAGFLRSAVPQGTKLKSVFVNENVVLVNLSHEFVDNMPPTVDNEMLAVYAVVNSVLANIETADAVQILVEGERLPTARGNVDIEMPLIANTALGSGE